MRVVKVARVLLTALLATAPLAQGQYHLMGEHLCLVNSNCGGDQGGSAYCWTPTHPQGGGSGYCTMCMGSAVSSYCVKSFARVCPYLGTNQPCGEMWAGTCVGTGEVGFCVRSYRIGSTCSVPNCAVGVTDPPIPDPD